MYGLFELQRYGQERVLKVRWLKGNRIVCSLPRLYAENAEHLGKGCIKLNAYRPTATIINKLPIATHKQKNKCTTLILIRFLEMK
jgi:hypothetical protein